MKAFWLLFFLLLLTGKISFASITMRQVDPRLLIAAPETDFSKISEDNQALKIQAIRYLFDQDMLGHMGSKAYDPKADFNAYLDAYEANYFLVDLDRDGILELVFNGFIDPDGEIENIEIYLAVKDEWLPVFTGKGNLIAYKKHPNTGEILLYQHQYPCCNNGSHNLNRLRLAGGKIQLLKRFFVGRDTNMVGPFFPEKSAFDEAYRVLRKETTVHWSPKVVKEHAWEGRTPENVIAHYEAGTIYRVLGKKGRWSFVLLHGPPIQEENKVINPANFGDVWIYGWIQ